MRFIKGRDAIAVTIFVPFDCQNNCKFCTSKKEYRKYELDINKTKESIIKINKLGFDKFVFTGGEPFANVEKLNELISLIDENKTVYINTTLPLNSIDESIAYINSEKRIKGISISRHSEISVKLNNIASDNYIPLIKKPVRINSVVDDNLNVKAMIDRFSRYNVLLNLRADYRYVTNDNLKVLDGEGLNFKKDSAYHMLYEGGCNVCQNFEFVRLSDGFKVQYHKGLEHSAIVKEDVVIYNDLIVKPNGKIYYDWDNKNEYIKYLIE